MIKPKALSSSMSYGKRAAESMKSADYEKERELIRKRKCRVGGTRGNETGRSR